MRIFVTGGSGFLGQRIIQRLLDGQHHVTALSRSAESDGRLHRLRVDIVRGELNDSGGLERALAGHDAVVHAAAPVEIWGARAHFQRGIVEGSQALFTAAARQHVARFIHISSESVLQDGVDLVDIDETTPYPTTPNSSYGEAKRDIERWLREPRDGPHVVILRPPYIWGPGNRTIDDIAAKIRAGQFLWVDGGKVPFEMVHVDNIAEAVVCALTRGTDRSVYIITDDRAMTVKGFLKPLLAAQGVHVTNRSTRGTMARPAAVAIEAVWRALRLTSNPPVSRFQLDFIGRPRRYRIDRAKSELGYRPVRTFEEGLAEVRAWHARQRAEGKQKTA